MIGEARGFVQTADLSTALRFGRDDNQMTDERLTTLVSFRHLFTPSD
jgi:hypothetical protein